ncbi:MAG: regulatory protein RecX [Candidatus Bipolaricaulia bacterium]
MESRCPPRETTTPTRSDAWGKLSQLLRRTPLTEKEASNRLRRAGFSPEDADAAVRRAIEENRIDDRLFARLWVDDRLLHHPLSRRAVEQELTEKAVPREHIAAALDASYPPSHEPEVARRLAAARWARLAAIDAEARRRRVLDHLLRRGFAAGLAADIVRRVEREEESCG